MAKSSPIKQSFNAGEASPLLDGRTDLVKYGSLLSVGENYLPLVQGPAIFRGGWRFVGEVKLSANRTWLVPFSFNVSQNFILEFGHQYIRFFANHAQVLSGMALYEIASPYTAADLTDSKGRFTLGYRQSGDVIYLTHPGYQTRKLTRLAATNWTMTLYAPNNGPFLDLNTDQTKMMFHNGRNGTISITANFAAFAPTDVGRLIYLEQKLTDIVPQWEPGKAITAGVLRRSGRNNYVALNSATTGTVKPTHSEGSAFDGDTGVNWAYLDSGFGIGTITGYTNATLVTVLVSSNMPDGAFSVSNYSYRWKLGAWGSAVGWPEKVAFFRDRLMFGKGNRVFGSVTSDYENMAEKIGGVVTADSAINVQLTTANPIQAFAESNDFLVLTSGEVWLMGEISKSEPFGPDNVSTRKQRNIGSAPIPPIEMDESVLFAQTSGRRLQEILYSFDVAGYKLGDLSLFSEHLLRQGLNNLALSAEPYSIAYATDTTGLLLSFTYKRDQEAAAWMRHPCGGGGIVESIATITSPDGANNELWGIIRLTVNGVTKRYVCYKEPEFEGTDAQLPDAFYVDCGATYSGAPATVISGLDYLEGKQVTILADGATHPMRTVTAGQITLQAPASKVQVGLGYVGKLRTMRMETGTEQGTAQGKLKRINHVIFRFLRTLGGRYGNDESKLDEHTWRLANGPMNTPPPLFTGDKRVAWPHGTDTEGYITHIHDVPMPSTVISFVAEAETNERNR